MRVAPPILLPDEQRNELGAVAASRTASVRFAQRARMILLAADGKQDVQIAAEVGVRRQAVRATACKNLAPCAITRSRIGWQAVPAGVIESDFAYQGAWHGRHSDRALPAPFS
jgi:hypothetical protein